MLAAIVPAAVGCLMRKLPWAVPAALATAAAGLAGYLLWLAPDAGLAGIGLAIIAVCAPAPAAIALLTGYWLGRALSVRGPRSTNDLAGPRSS